MIGDLGAHLSMLEMRTMLPLTWRSTMMLTAYLAVTNEPVTLTRSMYYPSSPLLPCVYFGVVAFALQ